MSSDPQVEILFSVPFPLKQGEIPGLIAELSGKIADLEELVQSYRRGIDAIQSQCFHVNKTYDDDNGWTCNICGKMGGY